MSETRDDLMVEIQKQLNEVLKGNTRIEAKIDVHNQQLVDHEARLRELEGKSGKRWESISLAAITALFVGVIGFAIGKLF